jgi:CheY-like chemotaxis protein
MTAEIHNKETASLRPLNVLIFDDLEDAARLGKFTLEAFFEDSYNAVDTATTTQEFFNQLNKSLDQNNPYDAIVLDFNLPHEIGGAWIYENGYKVLQTLKQHSKLADIPVIMYTIYEKNGDPELQKALEMDNVVYLQKPADAEKLHASITKLVTRNK